MVQHIQAENIRDTGSSKRKLLRVGDCVEPRAPYEIRRDNVHRKLLEETGSGPDFNGKTIWFSKGEQSSEKLFVVDAPQDGFMFPNTAVPKKLLLGLRIDGHCVFLIVLSSAPREHAKLARLFRQVTNDVDARADAIEHE